MTTILAQLGFADEVTYGTPVTPTRFAEFNSESIKLEVGRVESSGLRSGSRTLRADRFMPYRKGAAGSIEFDVQTKGFGFWLKHMLGTVATTGPVDANYTHTGTVGSLLGDFFTMQIGRPFNPSGTVQPFTYHGGKVTGWELSCDVDGVLVASLDLDFEDEDTSTALAVASYPTDTRVFAFVGAALTIAGSQVEVRNVKFGGDNALNADRRYLRGSGLKKEPVEAGPRSFTWSADADFSDLTQYDRVRSATSAGALAQLVATFDGPIAHGGTTLPRITITAPACRFDEDSFNISGATALMQSLSGKCLDDGTNSPVSIAYRTTDSAP